MLETDNHSDAAKLEILFFGSLKEIAGTGSIQVPIAENTNVLISHLYQKYPLFRDQAFLIAVNRELVHANNILHPGDIVALLPPFAGG